MLGRAELLRPAMSVRLCLIRLLYMIIFSYMNRHLPVVSFRTVGKSAILVSNACQYRKLSVSLGLVPHRASRIWRRSRYLMRMRRFKGTFDLLRAGC